MRPRGRGLDRCSRALTLAAMDSPATDGRHASGRTREAKRGRQRVMRELVTRFPIANQLEFALMLGERGYDVTQATVSRDIAELGLVKVVRGERHVYASPDDLIRATSSNDESLRRILSDLPVSVRRSGLTLLLVSGPGSASAIAQAIDESTFDEQEGTLAGDNTVLVLFADEERLQRWRDRFDAIRGIPGPERFLR